MSETIEITDKLYYQLGIMKRTEKDTYNDVIQRLVDEANEEFTDEQAEEFNRRIEKFESGDFSDTVKYDRVSRMRYVIEGINRDSTPKKPAPTIEELEKLLKYDNPKGNGLDKLCGIIDDGEIIDEVEEKRSGWRG